MGDLWQNQTLVAVKVLTPYVQGNGYITDLGFQNSVGNLMAFTFTLNGVGAVDFTP